MDTWSKQSGFPILTVTKDGEDLVISQKSFLLEKVESAKKYVAAATTDDDSENDDIPEK